MKPRTAPKPQAQPKVIIETPYGPVTESARLQCAANMRLSPEIRARVEAWFINKYGGTAEGLAVCQQNYPEAYADAEAS